MKVGIIGLGKLGLPVALAIESKGHEVCGFDVNPDVRKYLRDKSVPFVEQDIQPLLDDNHITMHSSIEEVVAASDIVFVPIQTPHDPKYEGTTRIPDDRKDFDYTYLKKGLTAVAAACEQQKKHTTVVVISTCLPGTFNRELKPLLNKYVNYVYNPFFIAMGTVIPDFLKPEFVLIGTEDKESTAVKELSRFYRSIHSYPLFITDTTTAEGIKVFYNTFITMKTVLGNIYGEMSHKLGMNVDDIYQALSMATDRIISPKYLKSGVGDGGGCHPRDNIALSYIAQQVGLSHNIFEDLMAAREDHMDWIAREAVALSKQHRLPVVILGKAFKPETNITTGSPSVLLAHLIWEHGVWAEHQDGWVPLWPAIYVIGTQHDKYKDYKFPKKSVVLDPFRYLKKQPGVELIAIGAK